MGGSVSTIVAGYGFNPPWSGGDITYGRGLLESIFYLKDNYSLPFDLHVGLVTLFDYGNYTLLMSNNSSYLNKELRDFNNLLDKLNYCYIKYDLGYSTYIKRRFKEFILSIRGLTCFKEDHIIHDYGLMNPPWPIYYNVLNIYKRKTKTIYMKHILTPIEKREETYKIINLITKKGGWIAAPSSSYIKNDINKLGLFNIQSSIIPPCVHIYREKKPLFEMIEGDEYYNRIHQMIKDDNVLLYIGTLNISRFPSKQIVQMLKILKKQNNRIKLIIVTRKPEKDRHILEGLISFFKRHNVYNDVIIIDKFLTSYEKKILFNMADILITNYQKPLDLPLVNPPLTILEAMASGCVVATNDVYGLSELVIDKQRGLILDLSNPKSVDISINKIYDVLTNKKTKRDIIEKQLDYVEATHSEKAVAKILYEVYTSLFK